MILYLMQMSRLVVSEVIRGTTMASRVAVIEKWVAVADICRCLHNYNGVLQVIKKCLHTLINGYLKYTIYKALQESDLIMHNISLSIIHTQ